VDDKEAIKNYENGIDKKKYKKEERLAFLEKALEIEPEYPAANFAYAQEKIVTIKLRGGTYDPIIPYMQKVVEKCPKLHSDPYYYLGFAYYEKENYPETIKYLEQFVNFNDDDDTKFAKDYDEKLAQSKELIKYSKIYKNIADLRNNPVPFDPNPINDVCTEQDEYLPIISPDNNLILFTRRLPFTSKNQTPGMSSDKLIEVFSVSKRISENKFEVGGPMPTPPFNKNENEGGATISIDNKHLFYTICKDEGGAQMNCDVYYSDLVDGKWTEVQKVEGVNDKVDWDSQPSIAADGKSLYFGSDRKGGYGGIDIYKSVRDETGKWSPPENLGPTINTSGNDKTPFIHSDSETLYFSSDGQPGFGGYDIFYSKKDDDGKWREPKNIGYPINTEADDLGFFAGLDGKYGYFASNKREKVKGRSKGGWDIYSFELYKEARPEEVRFVKGTLKTETGEALTGAKVEIKSSESKKETDVVVDTSTGEYAAIVNIRKKEDFILTVKKDGYAFNSQVVSVKNDTMSAMKPVKIDFEVKPIEVGKNYILNNIYYATNSAELKKESMIVIEEFVQFLKDNPTIKIEIHGFTDNVGSDESNIQLSNERAFTVYDKLQSRGIDKSRLAEYKGFGKANPIASNDTEAGRAKNRRTEFVIIEK
jgi:outer membrane protein OmpA-like peptidoglycan-associated protein